MEKSVGSVQEGATNIQDVTGEIKKAVEEIFKVQVEKVNTLIVKGKTVSRNTKSGVTVGNTGDYKKAIVTLTKDSKPIAFFESLS